MFDNDDDDDDDNDNDADSQRKVKKHVHYLPLKFTFDNLCIISKQNGTR